MVTSCILEIVFGELGTPDEEETPRLYLRRWIDGLPEFVEEDLDKAISKPFEDCPELEIAERLLESPQWRVHPWDPTRRFLGADYQLTLLVKKNKMILFEEGQIRRKWSITWKSSSISIWRSNQWQNS